MALISSFLREVLRGAVRTTSPHNEPAGTIVEGYPTSGLPSAAQYPEGAGVWDVTLKQFVYSDGLGTWVTASNLTSLAASLADGTTVTAAGGKLSASGGGGGNANSIKSPVKYCGPGGKGSRAAGSIVYGGNATAGHPSAQVDSGNGDYAPKIEGVTQTTVAGSSDLTDVITSGATEVLWSGGTPSVGTPAMWNGATATSLSLSGAAGSWVVYVGTIIGTANYAGNGTVLINFQPLVLGRIPTVPPVTLLDVQNVSIDTIPELALVGIVPGGDGSAVNVELARVGTNAVSGVMINDIATLMIALTPGETQKINFDTGLTVQVGDLVYASDVTPGVCTNVKPGTSGHTVGRVGVIVESGHYVSEAYCGVFILPYFETKVP